MNPVITNPQSTGIIERMMIVWATLAAAKIVALIGIDPAYTDWIAAGILSMVAGVIGWWQTKPSVVARIVGNMSRETLAKPEVAAPLVAAAAAVPNPAAEDGRTVVVTSPELERATPGSPTVVSSTDNRVVPH